MSSHRKICVVALVLLFLLAGCYVPKPDAASPAIPTLPQVSLTTDPPAVEGSVGPLTQASEYIEGARMFNEQEALKHVEFLASDEFKGRLVGTPENQKAGNYIADRFAEYGLQPAGVNNSYFQPFTASVVLNIKQPVLTVFHPASDGSNEGSTSRTYVTHDDYMPRTGAYIGSGDFTGQVVLLPYCNPDDLDASFAGKIVLCNVKPGFAPPMLIDKMLENKSAGFLLIYDKGPYPRSGYGIGELIDMPAFRISPEVTEDILRGSGYTLETLDQLTAPLILSTTVHMAAAFEFSMTSARNVLGLLPGSDPQHKDEIVVIGTHYDHVGRDPDGTIFNGANDNASGVAEMLELAHLWQTQGFRPARSVLFAAWDAEEEGYFGSFNYVTYPGNLLFQKTVAMLNLDMAGIGDTIFIAGQSTMTDQLQASAAALGYSVNYDPAGGSDDISFQDAGIPAGLVSIDPDTYEETLLHRPEDDPQMIHLKSLRMVGVVTAHALAAWSGGGPKQLQD